MKSSTKKPSKKQKAKIKKVLHEWKAGTLNSGSKDGPIVPYPKDRKRAAVIALSSAGMSRKNSMAYQNGFLAISSDYGRLPNQYSVF